MLPGAESFTKFGCSGLIANAVGKFRKAAQTEENCLKGTAGSAGKDFIFSSDNFLTSSRQGHLHPPAPACKVFPFFHLQGMTANVANKQKQQRRKASYDAQKLFKSFVLHFCFRHFALVDGGTKVVCNIKREIRMS